MEPVTSTCPQHVDGFVDVARGRKVDRLMNDAEHLWTAAAQLLRAQVSEAVWLSTFQDAHPLVSDDQRLLLSVPNTHVKERIEGRYLALVRGATARTGSSRRRPLRRGAVKPHARRGRGRRRNRRARRSATTRLLRRVERPRAEWCRRAQPALRLRDVREGRLEPVRARGRPPRRRDTGAFVQPVVHLRRRRAGKDRTCCTRSATTSARITLTTRCATSPPRRS